MKEIKRHKLKRIHLKSYKPVMMDFIMCIWSFYEGNLDASLGKKKFCISFSRLKSFFLFVLNGNEKNY